MDPAIKPLLILPPAPARWPAMQDLPLHADPLWQQDLERRFVAGLRGAQDAFAVIPDGGRLLACAAICKRHDLGVLNRVFTRPEHRRRGLARAALGAVVAWFDMTGGKWLYATAPTDLAETWLAAHGFRVLRRSPRTPADTVVLLRAAADVPDDPVSTADGPLTIHDVARVNWPTLVALLVNRLGPDPRVPLDESAALAEQTALELLSRQEAGVCQLKAAFRGPRLVGIATVATDQLGDRTHAMLIPPTGAPPELRHAALALAQSKGYAHADFLMEALAPQPPEAGDGTSAAPSAPATTPAASVPG